MTDRLSVNGVRKLNELTVSCILVPWSLEKASFHITSASFVRVPQHECVFTRTPKGRAKHTQYLGI